MNDWSGEPVNSRKNGKGKGRGRGKGKKVIESDDDFELVEERAKSEDTTQSVDEDVLIYHREVSSILGPPKKSWADKVAGFSYATSVSDLLYRIC